MLQTTAIKYCIDLNKSLYCITTTLIAARRLFFLFFLIITVVFDVLVILNDVIKETVLVEHTVNLKS